MGISDVRFVPAAASILSPAALEAITASGPAADRYLQAITALAKGAPPFPSASQHIFWLPDDSCPDPASDSASQSSRWRLSLLNIWRLFSFPLEVVPAADGAASASASASPLKRLRVDLAPSASALGPSGAPAPPGSGDPSDPDSEPSYPGLDVRGARFAAAFPSRGSLRNSNDVLTRGWCLEPRTARPPSDLWLGFASLPRPLIRELCSAQPHLGRCLPSCITAPASAREALHIPGGLELVLPGRSPPAVISSPADCIAAILSAGRLLDLVWADSPSTALTALSEQLLPLTVPPYALSDIISYAQHAIDRASATGEPPDRKLVEHWPLPLRPAPVAAAQARSFRASAASAGASPMRASSASVPACLCWNRGQPCARQPCRYQHVCSSCLGPHAAAACSSPRANAPSAAPASSAGPMQGPVAASDPRRRSFKRRASAIAPAHTSPGERPAGDASR